jgi:hypothetical protein
VANDCNSSYLGFGDWENCCLRLAQVKKKKIKVARPHLSNKLVWCTSIISATWVCVAQFNMNEVPSTRAGEDLQKSSRLQECEIDMNDGDSTDSSAKHRAE